MSVSVNGPKTPLTKGSNGIATATLPNICKMPGPPAPFVPAPLPNIGKTGDKPKGYSKKVKIENKAVAIKGASFGSMGDMASKGTGGGMLSANTHGPCKFISPGSMDVKFEGKNVHLLSDLVTNNGGPSGSPPNAATMMGAVQVDGVVSIVRVDKCPICHDDHEDFKEDAQTKADASDLVNNYNPTGQYKKKPGTMIGVVHCKQGHKHAGRTGNDPKFVEVARPRGYHLSPQSPDQPTTIAKMLKVTGYSDSFQRVVQRAGILRERLGALYSGPADKQANVSRNPPGACAAQRALVSTLLHGCTPFKMTEKWSQNQERHGGRPAGPIRFIDSAGRLPGLPAGTLVPDYFGHGESTPPCETCNLLLPFLTCQKKEEAFVPAPGCPHASCNN